MDEAGGNVLENGIYLFIFCHIDSILYVLHLVQQNYTNTLMTVLDVDTHI